MFDPDDAGKEIRIQKHFGVPPGDKRLCENCGRPTMEYKPRQEDLDQGVETIQDRTCLKCQAKARA